MQHKIATNVATQLSTGHKGIPMKDKSMGVHGVHNIMSLVLHTVIQTRLQCTKIYAHVLLHLLPFLPPFLPFLVLHRATFTLSTEL